jgi:hypothetical protein
MHCNFHTYLINDNYSQEHADAQHDGKESENNRKYLWEDELRVTSDIEEVIFHESGIYHLRGEYPKGILFDYEVLDMLLYELKIKGRESLFLGASRQIVDKHIMEKKEDNYQLTIYLKDNEPFSDPVPGIYIASKAFPKELVF